MWIEGDSFRCIFSFFCVEARESLVDRRRREAQNQSYKRRSRLARALWIEGSSTFNVVPFPGSRLARALWIEGWSSVVTVIFNRVEARESLVDRRLPNSPLYQCDYRRGSREPCGSKEPLFYKQKRGLPSRLARALWIEGISPCIISCKRTSRLARALWIEGFTVYSGLYGSTVEARESLVDRRPYFGLRPARLEQSRLARALWIEG